MTVKEHYNTHLASFYSWMIGDFDKAKRAFKDFCIENKIQPFASRKAIDLGAGNGVQSIALEELGFEVIAVDFNDKLLSELGSKIDGLRIITVIEDLINIKSIGNQPVDLITCCGDTISHLETFEDLEKLFADSFDLLVPGGSLVLTFRDYSIPLSGTQRFIPVKSDDNRILTCVIDYLEDKIIVTDLLYEKHQGAWIQKVSSYNKLRVKIEYVLNHVRSVGYSVSKNTIKNGMVHLILTREE